MIQLVIATMNLHKIREMRSILSSKKGLDILTLHDFSDYSPPSETGKTFEENAFLKASHAASFLKKWVLADDSGLVIPALNNEPGIYSARYAGEQASDKDNRLKLLKNLEKVDESKRIGFFVCALALASPEGGVQKQVKGICEGTITMTSRGGSGFGYDSLFLKNDYNKTFAELDEEIKNRISHRRKALDKLMSALNLLEIS